MEVVSPPEPTASRPGKRCQHDYASKQGCPICSNCGHGKVKSSCPICNNCGHGHIKRGCPICLPCPHYIARPHCGICSGCPHRKLKGNCMICTPCPHGRRKRTCPTCMAEARSSSSTADKKCTVLRTDRALQRLDKKVCKLLVIAIGKNFAPHAPKAPKTTHPRHMEDFQRTTHDLWKTSRGPPRISRGPPSHEEDPPSYLYSRKDLNLARTSPEPRRWTPSKLRGRKRDSRD